MSSEFLHSFCMYQNAMLKVGTKDEDDFSVVPENSLDIDINEMMSVTVEAEKKLSEVMDASDSYNEILKMIM